MTSAAKSAALTPMQRKVLSAMSDGEPAIFNGEGSRRFGFGVASARYGGRVIRAYGLPEWFLQNRNFIERVERNVPGSWFRITEAGRAAIAKAKGGAS